MPFHVPEERRIRKGPIASDTSDGNNGAFLLRPIVSNRHLVVIASDGLGWDHVSASVVDGHKLRTPTWEEMSHVKGIFWDAEDVVMQIHPRRSQYVNNHPNVLHLWRPNDGREIPEPSEILVGVKDAGDLTVSR